METHVGINKVTGGYWPLGPSLGQGELEYDTSNLRGLGLWLMTKEYRQRRYKIARNSHHESPVFPSYRHYLMKAGIKFVS